MYTTINKLRKYVPDDDRLLESLSKTHAEDAPINISAIFASSGLEDALWCLRAVEGHDKAIRLYAVWCARQVQHLLTDARSRAALDVAERYVYGQASDEELDGALDASSVAARAARADEGNIARAASSARDAAWVALAAVKAAPGDAGIDAHDVAESAAGAAQEAAWEAAWDAARGSISQLGTPFTRATATFVSAREAGWNAMRTAQAAKLCEVCELIEATHVHNDR